MISRSLLLAAVLALSACFRGGGTEDTNDICVSGRLLDADEKSVPGAKVILSPRPGDPAGAPAATRPESTLTDRRGIYAFTRVAPGKYLLRILVRDAAGAEREASRRDLDLRPDENLELPPVSAALALRWSHRAGVVLDASPGHAGLAAGFPMLVRLSGSGFPADAQGAGKDLRFAKTDGTSLPYEIGRWDTASREADIWVRMDSVRLEAGAVIWMYWGNPQAEDISQGRSVFDSAAGFVGAWHLQPDSGSAARTLPDASAAGNHGEFQGTGPMASGAAVIGRGISFDGIDQYLSTTARHSDPDAFTLSLWFRADSAGGKLAGFESSRTGGSVFFDRHIWLDDAGRLQFGVFAPAPADIPAADSIYLRPPPDLPGEGQEGAHIQRILSAPGNFADGAWHQVTAVLSREGQFLYVDGALAASDARTVDAAAYPGHWRFGGGTLGDWVGRSGRDGFRGMIDEAMVSFHPRGAAWIRLAYLTQAPGAGPLCIQPQY